MRTSERERGDRRVGPDRVTSLSLLALAATVYVPLLLTAPGRVATDTNASLLLDPARLLRRSVSMWDPHVGLGTVPREQIGYLWPAGPYFWLTDQIGLADWVAQRIWIGTILLAAGAGVLFLARTWRWRPEDAAAAAFVYALSPYVTTLVTHDSVALLAFAGLPWLLALTIRALRTPGLRHPALFALVVATIGSVDPTALVLVALAPLGWILYSLRRSPEVTRASATWTAAKLGLATLAVNLWWIVGLSVQATNGLPSQPYAETAEVVASSSTSTEVLRGLGSWFFYADDRLGPLIGPSVDYTQRLWLIALTYGIAVVGLLGLGITRWRHRAFAIGVLAIGVVLAVGAHPWDDPSPVGRLIKAAVGTDVPLALRTPSRAVPLIALAVAVGIGALVGAAREESDRRGLGSMILVVIVAIAALPPLWLGGFVPTDLDRPGDVPDYWLDAAAFLESGDDTRVLEIPGIDAAAYRWGATGDPLLPAILDRPSAARALIPQGSAASADLLAALDRRLQDQTLDPDALAVVARLMNVGDVVTRNDLEYERYDIRRPRSVWDLVTAATGLDAPETFGPRGPDGPAVEPPVDEERLTRDRELPVLPAVAAFPVTDSIPIVHAHAAERIVYLSGSGTGIVDAAAAGLIDGRELVRYSADVTGDPDFVRTRLVDERALVVTDSNRARAERWTSLQDSQGYTEQADGGLLRSDDTDNRLPLFEDRPGIRTVSEHSGVAARATGYGNAVTFAPEHRPVNAVDGDPTTAWRVAAAADPRGERLELSSETAIETDRIRLVQANNGADNRWITEVDLRFDQGEPLRVALDETSRRTPGQDITIDQRAFESLSIEIVQDDSDGPVDLDDRTGVGFAEIDLGVAPTREYIRMPQDLLDAGGFRTLRYPLALVQTRERSASTDVSHDDEERSLARVVGLPTARSYRLTGTARLAAGAPTSILDDITGRATSGRALIVTATSTIDGGLDHLPSHALDDDPSTRWTSAFDRGQDQAITVESPTPRRVDAVALTVVDDDEHSVPTVAVLEVDGDEVSRTAIPSGRAGRASLRTVSLDVPEPMEGSSVTVSFPDVDERMTTGPKGQRRSLPLSIATLSIDGWAVGDRALRIDSGCRDDLVTVDGTAIPVRITGRTEGSVQGDGLDVRTCDDEAVTLRGGDRRFDASDGRVTGFDIDQLVWCSGDGGTACQQEGPLLPADEDSAPDLEVVDGNDATVHVRVTGARRGEPFWLVLGQSFEPGWEIIDSEVASEPTQLVDGFANGFLVTPDAAEFDVTMRFVPQNRVEIGLLLSVVGIVVALGLAIGSPATRGPVPIPLQEPLRRIRALTWEGALPTRRDSVVVGVGAGLAAIVVTSPAVGLAIGLLAGLATRREGWRGLFTVLPAALLGICAIYLLVFQVQHEIAPGPQWPMDTGRLHTIGLAAVVLLAVDLGIDHIWARRSDFR